MRWLVFFTITMIISSAFLWFAKPSPEYIHFTLFWVVIGTISFEMGHVFFNAYLPRLASPDKVGRASGLSFSAGFIGGIISLLIVLFVFIKNPPSWLDVQTAEQIRICGPFVALWIAIFSLPLIFVVPDTRSAGLGVRNAVRVGFREMLHTLKTLPKQKNLFLYIIAHMVYTDGMITLLSFGGIYASGTFHFSIVQVLYYGIAINASVAVGAFIFAWVDDYIGSKRTVLMSLFAMCLLGFPLVLTHSVTIYWITSLLIAMFIGPVQASSRSLMTRLDTPKEKAAEMFGLYALSNKISAFIGPLILGSISIRFDSQRPGMATIFMFFLVGAWMLSYVEEK